MTIQQSIRRLRKQRGITQTTLGKKVHLSGQTITQYETGKRHVSAEMMEYLLEALDAQFSITFSDTELQRKAYAKDFFEEWTHMENVFPQWNVLHTGGHIYILEREFLSKKGEPILVHLNDECVVLFKAIGGKLPEKSFASKNMYDANEDTYCEYAYEHETLIGEYDSETKQLKWLPLAEELFDEETLSLMLVASQKYTNAPSERHINFNIQQTIKHLREAKNFSQEELATAVHLTPSCIAQYERGTRNVTADGLADIIRALGATLTVVPKG